MRWPRSETAVSALLLMGVALCVVPWLAWRRPLDAPRRFDAAHAVVGRALAAVDEADLAFAQHDAERLRAAVTAEYLAALRASLRWLGVRLETAPGLPAGSLGEELRQRPFRGGRAGGDRLVLGFDLGDSDCDAGYPVACGLKLVVLQWNGHRLLLHAVQEEVLSGERDPDADFARLAARWLPAD
jgi:hypothetical protein